MNKTQLVAELVERGAGERRHVSSMLDHLAEVVASEVEKGEDVTIPGIVKFSFSYTPPKKKGERWKKGDERYNPITGETTVADSDSPAVKPRIKLRALPVGTVGQLKPGSKPEAQAEYLKSSTGKAVAKRKAK